MSLNILAVEDESNLHSIISDSLGPDFHVTCVTSCGDALEHLSSTKYSMILLDLHLPDGHGYEFYKRIKSQPHLRKVPIMILSGSSATGDKVMGFSLGVQDYMVKPFDPDELL